MASKGSSPFLTFATFAWLFPFSESNKRYSQSQKRVFDINVSSKIAKHFSNPPRTGKAGCLALASPTSASERRVAGSDQIGGRAPSPPDSPIAISTLFAEKLRRI